MINICFHQLRTGLNLPKMISIFYRCARYIEKPCYSVTMGPSRYLTNDAFLSHLKAVNVVYQLTHFFFSSTLPTTIFSVTGKIKILKWPTRIRFGIKRWNIVSRVYNKAYNHIGKGAYKQIGQLRIRPKTDRIQIQIQSTERFDVTLQQNTNPHPTSEIKSHNNIPNILTWLYFGYTVLDI